jgi:hypothetical protein
MCACDVLVGGEGCIIYTVLDASVKGSFGKEATCQKCYRQRYNQQTIKVKYTKHTEQEFLNNIWGLELSRNRVIVPARQAKLAGGIHSLESIPGLYKRLKIRAQDTVTFCTTSRILNFSVVL